MLELINKFLDSKASFMAFNGDEYEYKTDIGVKPIIIPMRNNIHYFKNQLVFDAVIGKAAALLLTYSNVSYVYGKIMSKAALGVFEENHIKYDYGTLVEYIENREKTGMCPLEEAVKDVISFEEAFEKIEIKINELMTRKNK